MTFSPLPVKTPEYAVIEKKVIFSKGGVKVSLLPQTSSEIKTMLSPHPIAEVLSSPNYTAFLLEIENSTSEKIIYNPVLTTLFDNAMGLHKPLDYTDLYTLIGPGADPETVLQGMKERFFDLSVTLRPGERMSRLLLFRSPEEGSSEGTVKMKEIYVGTIPIALSFEFKISQEVIEAQE